MKEPKEIAFQFEEIPLVEAENIVAAGEGRFSELIVMLTQKLPEIEQQNQEVEPSQRKSFAFGLGNGKEVDEKDRRSLCHTANLRLHKIGINWKITYSGNKKLFICVPTESRLAPVPRGASRPRSVPDSDLEMKAIELRKTGLTYGKIAQKLNIPYHKVDYWLWKKQKRLGQVKSRLEPHQEKVNETMSADDFVAFGKKVLNYSDNMNRNEGRSIKNALCIVGIKDFKFKGRDLDPAMGYKKGASNWNALYANAPIEVGVLRRELKEKGVLQ